MAVAQMAAHHRWCWNMYCGTCGAMSLRVALREAARGTPAEEFANERRIEKRGGARDSWPKHEQARLLGWIASAEIGGLASIGNESDWLGILGIALSHTEHARKALGALSRSFAWQLQPFVRPGDSCSLLLRDLLEGRRVLDWQMLSDFEFIRIGRDRTRHPLQHLNGHLVRYAMDGLEIIDTGSPLTIGAPAEVRRHVDAKVVRIVGMDELGKTPFLLDWDAGWLDTNPEEPYAARHESLKTMMGVPAVRIRHTGAAGQMAATALLDTGAPISYAPPSVVEHLEVVGEVTDFYPGVGTFTTKLYAMEVEFLGKWSTVRVGVLPPLLRMALSMFSPDAWILGAEVLAGRRIWIDVPGGRIADVPDEHGMRRAEYAEGRAG